LEAERFNCHSNIDTQSSDEERFMTILFYNNASTTLADPVGAADTTATLASGAGTLFSPGPTGSDYFCLTFSDAATGLQNEICHVTNVSGDTLTIVRAQEGTTAQGWSVNDLAENRVTAGSMQAIQASAAPSALKWTTARTVTVSGDSSGAVAFDGSADFSLALTNSQAAKLTTARTIAATGDVTWSVSFNGSAGVTNTATLATVNSSPGTTGDATHIAQVTTNGKGLVTSQSSVAIQTGSISQIGLLQLVSSSVDATLADATKALTAAAIGTLMPQGAGHITLPGGFVFQWAIGVWDPADGTEPTQLIALPVALKTSIYAAIASVDLEASSNTTDMWYQTVLNESTLTAIKVQRQLQGSYNQRTRPIVFVIGK
jgi:hypothetical protein